MPEFETRASSWRGLEIPQLAEVQLDALLEELLARVREITANRERLRGLLDAVVSIGSDLELPSVLERLVTSACELVDARYGALGIIGAEHDLTAFHTHGLTERQRKEIGELPCGRGILGVLIEDPRPLRLPDLTAHPSSYGFPVHHPEMRVFLGVPVLVRDKAYGNLYLTEKRGASEFTEDDERVVVALAAAAGIAIENARLYELSRRRLRWLEAGAEITEVLLGMADQPAALRLIAQRAREAAGADLALVVVRVPDEPSQLVIEVAVTSDGGAPGVGERLPFTDTILGSVIIDRQAVQIEDLGEIANWPVNVEGGAAVVAPLATVETPYGALIVATRDRTERFSDDELNLLEAFAGQAALGMDRARARSDRAQLAVLEDRDRIARDLHDLVIQRLFATGLQLQNVIHLTTKPVIAERVNSAVDSLDATIRDIRASIYALHGGAVDDLRLGVHTAVEAATEGLGFRPSVQIWGPVDSAVPRGVRPELLAVLREALSNITRHAVASTVEVVVTASASTLELMVTDDGNGIRGSKRGNGLRNLAERARQLGGEFTVEPAEPSGTRVLWRVPLT